MGRKEFPPACGSDHEPWKLKKKPTVGSPSKALEPKQEVKRLRKIPCGEKSKGQAMPEGAQFSRPLPPV